MTPPARRRDRHFKETIAARRVGASWAELQAVVALAALLRGMPAADLGAAALASIVKR